MYESIINPSARSMSLHEITECANPGASGLNDEWLEAITNWANDPDMVLILTGPPLDNALTKVTKHYSPRMACARMMADYFSHLSGCKHNYIPSNYKMTCEIVDGELWIWHT